MKSAVQSSAELCSAVQCGVVQCSAPSCHLCLPSAPPLPCLCFTAFPGIPPLRLHLTSLSLSPSPLPLRSMQRERHWLASLAGVHINGPTAARLLPHPSHSLLLVRRLYLVRPLHSALRCHGGAERMLRGTALNCTAHPCSQSASVTPHVSEELLSVGTVPTPLCRPLDSAPSPSSPPPSLPPPHLQPLFQPCGRPSPHLWHVLRSHHLLPPAGLPIVTLSHQHAPQPVLPNTPAPMTSRNWVVIVIGPSPAGKSAAEFRALSTATFLARKFLVQLFGRLRVVTYRTSPPETGQWHGVKGSAKQLPHSGRLLCCPCFSCLHCLTAQSHLPLSLTLLSFSSSSPSHSLLVYVPPHPPASSPAVQPSAHCRGVGPLPHQPRLHAIRRHRRPTAILTSLLPRQ